MCLCCIQEVQQLKKSVKDKDEQLGLAQRSGRDLQARLLVQTQAEHTVQRDNTQLKVQTKPLCACKNPHWLCASASLDMLVLGIIPSTA